MRSFFRIRKSSKASFDSRPRKQGKRSGTARDRTLAFESLEGRAMLSLSVTWDPTHGAPSNKLSQQCITLGLSSAHPLPG